LIICISQSGETADTLAALRLAKEKGAYVVGIVNAVGSTIAREVDKCIYTYAGPEIAVATTKGYTSQVAIFSTLALMAMEQKGLLDKNIEKLIKNDMLNIEEKINSVISNREKYLEIANCILVDEAQFLSTNQVNELFIISKACDIPVICYGLRNNFKMESFAGSKKLLETADVLEELTTLCSCGQIARYVGRKVGEHIVLEGDEIVIDGTENIEYVPLCGVCYLKRVKKLDLDLIRKNLIDEVK